MRSSVKAISVLLAAVLLLAVFPLCAFSADTAVRITLSGPDVVYVDGEMVIRINVDPSTPLAAVEFSLSYDENSVSPIVTDNEGDKMDAFFVTKPKDWIQLCYLDETENKYYLRFADESGKNPLKTADSLVIDVPFNVVGAGNIAFTAENKDIIAVADKDLSALTGVGSSFSAVSSGETEKFSVNIKEITDCKENGKITLETEITDLGDGSGLVAFEYKLLFDKKVFSPVVTENSENEMDIFMSSFPNNNWEQMCSYNKDEGSFTLRFAALEAGKTDSEILKIGDRATVKIEFNVIGVEGDVGEFSIPYNSIIAVNGVTGVIQGVGSKLSVSVSEPDPTPVIDEKYTVVDGKYLKFVVENTSVSTFLSDLRGFYLTDKNGKPKTSGTVFTGDILVSENGETKLTVCVRGDANGNGKVDATDYGLVKRSVLGTYDMTPEQALACALKNGVTPVALDYNLIKRHVLKTYNINS